MEATVRELDKMSTVGTSGSEVAFSCETRKENSRERIRETGPGAELLRRLYVEQLQVYMEAFYEHGSFADVVALCRALELSEEKGAERTARHATVLESLLEMLRLEPAGG